MAILRKTVIDQLEWQRGGGFGLRFALLIDEDGEDVEKRWHRTFVWNSDEVEPTLAAVNADLARMKYDTLGPVQINRIKNVILAIEGVVGKKQPPAPPTLLQLIGQTP